MIYILSGSIILVVGLLFLIAPAKKPSQIYGYLSYLAQINPDSFKYAQKISRNTAIITGLIQIGLGTLIHQFKLDNLLFLWLVTVPVFILPFFMVTELKLKKFLLERDELPTDFQNPDDRPPKPRTRGFKDM